MPARRAPTPWDHLVGEGGGRHTISVARLRIPAQVFPLGEAIGIREALFREPQDAHLPYVPVPASLLNDFGRLESVDDIVRFVGCYGPLRLCRHALPYGWDDCDRLISRYYRCDIETLELWKLTISAANSLQRAAVDLASNRWAAVEDQLQVQRWLDARYRAWRDGASEADDSWEHFSREFWREESDAWFVEYQRGWLASSLNHWLARGEIRPEYHWRNGRLELEFSGQTYYGMEGISLVGAIAVQLAHAIAGTETTEICSACGKPFFAARRRAKSRDRFCSLCGNDAARRAAKVRYNAKRRAAKSARSRS